MIINPTIVLVLKSGGDFQFRDIELISYHIRNKWKSSVRPRIICLWDKATDEYDLGYVKILPLKDSGIIGTWARIQLYSPQMEQYKPFLYIDLDTAVIQSLENIFDLVGDPTKFITLEDFYQRDKLATGLVWFPANCEKTKVVWKNWIGPQGWRMDYFIRKYTQPDLYWQQITSSIKDFKPLHGECLTTLPEDTGLVCFHGHPRIFEATNIKWVKDYINQVDLRQNQDVYPVTVIIPYNKDRGWLKNAIASVPLGVQLLLSQGKGNWPENFNKVLPQADRKYVRWLHEDDMLTMNCIEDSIKTFEKNGADFIHGNAYEIFMNAGRTPGQYKPPIQKPTLADLLNKNVIHSATLMYKREVFDKVGLMDETLNTAEEFEFNCRCLKAGLKIGFCNSFLAWYRRHPQQKVRTVSKQDKDLERELVKNKYKI